MTISRPMRYILGVLSVLLLLTYSGCKSTPEPEPEEEPVVEQPVEETPEEPEPEPPVVETPEELAQEDINAARAAVRRANLIGANTFFPSEYRDLLDKLNKGIALGDTDPDAARVELAEVIKDANALYDKTLMAQRADYEARYARGDAALLDIEADKFAPDKYRHTQELAMETAALYEAGDLAASKAKADETLAAQARLHYNLSENIRYVGILKRDTENYIGDAEDNEAFIYAPDELAAANDTYFQGVSAYRNYDLPGSAAVMTEAKRQAVLAARTAAVRKRQSETDTLMTETQRRIEEASRLRTLTEEGQVLEARPWEGNEYLQSNPLVDHSADVGVIEIDDPELRDLDEPVDDNGDGVPEDVPIEDENTQVNADEQGTDYLAFARTLWEKGVAARNEGQFDLAQDYFRQAQAYIDVYEANAVLKTYTVVWRETATDCLWRIAERDEIFDNPFLWPKIWRANRRIIQNPDLIYPGQVLVIPPK
jgi:nucleoid-associated protein YgaU